MATRSTEVSAALSFNPSPAAKFSWYPHPPVAQSFAGGISVTCASSATRRASCVVHPASARGLRPALEGCAPGRGAGGKSGRRQPVQVVCPKNGGPNAYRRRRRRLWRLVYDATAHLREHVQSHQEQVIGLWALLRPRARRMTGASELDEANAAPVPSDAIMAAAAPVPVRRLDQMMGVACGN